MLATYCSDTSCSEGSQRERIALFRNFQSFSTVAIDFGIVGSMQLEQTDLLQFQPQVELPAETSIAPSDYLLLYAATVMDPEAQMRSNSPFWRLQLCLFNRLYWLRHCKSKLGLPPATSQMIVRVPQSGHALIYFDPF